MQQPRLCNLHGRDAERCCNGVHNGGLQRVEAAEGEVRDVCDALLGELVDEGVVAAVGEVVKVLDADDLGKGLGLGELVWRDGAQADMVNQALLLEFDEHLQRFYDGSGLGRGQTAQAEVDDIESFEAQIAQVVLDALDQICTRTVKNPGAVFATASAHLGDDVEVFRVRMQGFLDDLVGDVRAVEVAGVNVVDTGSDGFAQDGDGFRAVAGRAEDVGAGELHCAVTNTVNGERSTGEVECAAELNLLRHICVSPIASDSLFRSHM